MTNVYYNVEGIEFLLDNNPAPILSATLKFKIRILTGLTQEIPSFPQIKTSQMYLTCHQGRQKI